MFCPICTNLNQGNPRYPNSVCDKCLCKYGAMTDDNKRIDWYNIDISGGLQGYINGKQTSVNHCYINGIKCIATEARFGGVVFTPFKK